MSLQTMLAQLGTGFLTTLEIFALTLVFSLPLGLLIAFGRMSKNVVLRSIVKIYISIMRGTPLMLQLIVVYFGPHYLWNASLRGFDFPAIIIAFVLNYSAYFAEIYRSGIESIPKGQYEAAKVLGYNKFQTFMKIILPQVIKRIMPPVTNETITLVKDTSLSQVLTIGEMFTIAKRITATMSSLTPLFVAGIFYYVFNYLVAFVMERIEKKLSYYQ